MEEEKIRVTAEFDGRKIFVDGLEMEAYFCWFTPAKISVPPKYALLLLKKDTRNRARKFIHEVSVTSFGDSMKKSLLNKACENGFDEAEKTLKTLRVEAPNGKPRFYKRVGYNLKIKERELVVTDGKHSYEFRTSFDIQDLKLPLNVYTDYTNWTGVELTKEECDEARENIRVFFAFTKRFEDLRYERAARNCYDSANEVFDKFFTERKQAYELLDRMENKVDRIRKRNELYGELKEKHLLKTSNGFLIYAEWNVFFVSEDGAFYMFTHKSDTSLKWAVYGLVVEDKVPRSKIEPQDEEEIREVARILGKVKPELVPVILP